jgi:elongation factor Ts
MPEITAEMVRDLREKTGAGMMDCKKALVESQGDFTKAEEYLRKKGITTAAKKAGRVAAEGVIGSYIHSGKIGVIVEINCETDFVARNDDFIALAKDVAMHVAAANPQYVRREEIPADLLEKEKEIHRQQLRDAKKPEAIWEKIITGKIEKFYETVCLVDQPWFREDKKKVQEIVTEKVAKIGENISIRRFTRYQVGEGIEKKKEDLAAEVAKTVAAAQS